MPTRRQCANAIRALAIDAIEKSRSGHPGAPLGMADMAEALWRHGFKHNPANPGWMDREPHGVLGVSACSDDEEWRYYIAVSSSAEIDGSLEEYTVPSCTWAIFPGAGTGKSIQELEKRIVTEWLPTSGYEFTYGPDVEVYFDPDPQNTVYEVWIPVKKKQA